MIGSAKRAQCVRRRGEIVSAGGRKMTKFSSDGINYELASQVQQSCLYMSTDNHGNVDYTFLMGHGHTQPQIITAFQEKDRDRYLDREYQD